MSDDFILFVLLILLVISVLYVFGYQEIFWKTTQPRGSAKQSSSGDSEQKSMTESIHIASDEYREKENDVANEQNISILNEYMAQMGVLRGLMKFIKENIKEWKKRKLNIAIVGNSGTGKSSLINAVRGLKPSDDKAAPVGLTETTTKKMRYAFPNNENAILWDLPGVGTRQFQKKEYLEELDIRQYDIFVIVSASRFTENEIWLAEEILKQKNFIFFVRTKVDIDLMNDKRDHPKTFDAGKRLEEMRTEIRNNVVEAEIQMSKAGIFLVSSVEKELYDFQAMFQKLRELAIPKGVCVQDLIQANVKKVVIKERDAMKDRFKVQKGFSAIFPIITYYVFGVEIVGSLSEKMYISCKEDFCLNNNTLQEISKEIRVSIEDLKKHHLHFFEKIETKSFFSVEPSSLNPFHDTSRGISERLFPGYYIFKKKLHDVCDILAKDQEILVQLRLSRLTEQLTPLQKFKTCNE